MGSITYKKRAQLSAIVLFVFSIILFTIGGILYGISEKTLNSNIQIEKRKFQNNFHNYLPNQRLPHINEIFWKKLRKFPKFLEYDSFLKKKREKQIKTKEKLKECSRIIFIIGWGNIFLCPFFICIAIYFNTKGKRDTPKRDRVCILKILLNEIVFYDFI